MLSSEDAYGRRLFPEPWHAPFLAEEHALYSTILALSAEDVWIFEIEKQNSLFFK